ncbi:hypothetical protein BCCR75502_03499 [Burkholderia sola]|uniref:hypothetical protein n=1 Tax=Burkholderia cenocepacia TaxID=95486 RepID=UPI00067843C3|nr:hypothetical protein [Burkholderia cenocepacia]OXI70467.1 hypothetical protein CFB44_18410 [Burkholderia sp. AU31280]KWU20349.1 hypothetical protein AS149_39820 [Burkholderia cenocepacia]RQV14575.1 hypothetical protein DF132_30455 [Burkholderia cenocepacia]RQV26145.1 hypothetical protein DF039_05470 [Burkholderia cenocepacia]RQV73252.1 hypothetical protein DF018_06380 [Burkholderia cenocepacia]
MTVERPNFNEIESLLRRALDLVASKIPDRDRGDVSEYLDHGEYGVAYELLEFVLDKQQVAHPDFLSEAARKMGMALPTKPSK